MTVRDLIITALRELGIVDVSDAAPGTPEIDLGLGLLNRIFDDWNAVRQAVYADVHTSLVALTPALNPHTIGPSGAAFTATGNRPVSIEGIRLSTDNGETYLPPLVAHDAGWWHALQAPGTAAALPTDFYYDPTWPHGSIYFYPEPTSAATKAQIRYRIVLSQVALGDTFTLPPGYVSAVTETLKERLASLPMFASAMTLDLKASAREARALAFSPNETVARMGTADLGTGAGAREYDVQLGPFSLLRR